MWTKSINCDDILLIIFVVALVIDLQLLQGLCMTDNYDQFDFMRCPNFLSIQKTFFFAKVDGPENFGRL